MTIRAPPRKEKERQAMRAVFSNLEDAYEAGYADGMAEIRKRYRGRQEKKSPPLVLHQTEVIRRSSADRYGICCVGAGRRRNNSDYYSTAGRILPFQ